MMMSPASIRAISIASSPNGTPPAVIRPSHSRKADVGFVTSSNPSSPENPVRSTVAATPATSTGSGQKRKYPSSSSRTSVSSSSKPREPGPWIEIIGIRSVTCSTTASRPPALSRNQSSRSAVLIITQNFRSECL